MGRQPVVLALAVLLVVPGVVASAGATGQESGVSLGVQEFDRTEFHIAVLPNGSARWTFEYGRRLGNDTEREQFREFAREFENGSVPLFEEFTGRARALAADGENVTGREMAAVSFAKRARITGLDEDLGVVEMSFTWQNFGRVDGDRVVIGDVFDGGLYVGPGQQLVFEATGSLRFAGADPPPDRVSAPDGDLSGSDSVTWLGEREFTDERPRVVLAVVTPTTETTDAPAGTTSTATTATTDPGGATGANGGPPGSAALTAVPWLLVTFFAAVVVVGAVVLLQRAGIAFDDGWDGEPSADGEGLAASRVERPEPAVPDEEMLTDEERVLGLLRRNGGRMRQVNIVEETGWSKSKVSMLLSDMEDDDQLTRIRVGRENIVSLPGHEPDASDSPYDS